MWHTLAASPAFNMTDEELLVFNQCLRSHTSSSDVLSNYKHSDTAVTIAECTGTCKSKRGPNELSLCVTEADF